MTNKCLFCDAEFANDMELFDHYRGNAYGKKCRATTELPLTMFGEMKRWEDAMKPCFCERCKKPSCDELCIHCRVAEIVKEINEDHQRAALRQRLDDMYLGVHLNDTPATSADLLILGQVAGKAFGIEIPIEHRTSINSIVNYLWQKGVRA